MKTKTRLGSRVKAMMAYHIVNELSLFDIEEEFVSDSNGDQVKCDVEFDIEQYPEWRFIGIGSTRVCLLNDGVVYKVDMRYSNENSNEFFNYRLMQSKLIDGWFGNAFRIAECELIEFNTRGLSIAVIAMEYVAGEHATPMEGDDIDCMIDKEFRITDTWSGNIRRDIDGNLVLIDYSR